MLMAFRRTSLLFLTGQTSTQMPHPVQSSGATWIVYFMPAHSLSRASVDLKVAERASQFLAVVDLDADDGVRADHGALAALDADLRIPRGNFERQVALLPFRRAGGESAVAGECAHRKFVAAAGVDRAQHVVLELRRAGKRCGNFGVAGDGLGNLHFEKVSERLIDGAHVLLHDFFALAAVGVANRFADRLDRFLAAADTFEMAKKHTCMMVFMREPMPASCATW